jgi:hypothetical protein
MASLVEIKGNYYLQFYDGNKSPSQKKVSLGTRRKRVAQKLKRKYEDAYALGEYDPWTGKKLNEPDRYLDVREALNLFLKEKRQAGLAESSIGSYKGIVERSGVLEMPVDSVQKSDVADFVYDSEVAKATRHKRYRHLRLQVQIAFKNIRLAHPFSNRPRTCSTDRRASSITGFPVSTSG